MFGLSGEHLLILAGILLIFGPKKLPELGSSIGKAVRNFKEGFNAPANSGKLESKNAEPSMIANNEMNPMNTTQQDHQKNNSATL